VAQPVDQGAVIGAGRGVGSGQAPGRRARRQRIDDLLLRNIRGERRGAEYDPGEGARQRCPDRAIAKGGHVILRLTSFTLEFYRLLGRDPRPVAASAQLEMPAGRVDLTF